MTSSLRAIVFDMDGLMVNTEPLSCRSWQMVLEPYGHTLTAAVYSRMIGLRIDQSVAMIQENYPTPLTAAELIAQKAAYMAEICADGIPPMPGLMELQAEIGRRGIPWGVATSSRRQHAVDILQQLGLWTACHAVVGGDEAPHGKPAPDLYLMAAERLGVDPQQCLALEDSGPGCQAAATAGMVTIAIPTPETRHSSAFTCANHIFNSLHEVTARLDSLIGS